MSPSAIKWKREMTHVAKKILDNIRLSGDGRSLDGILVKLVLLGQGDRLLPALVVAVNVSCDLAEEDQIMLLQPLGKCNGIEVVVVIDRVTESLVIFLLDQQVVDSIVYGPLVLSLDIEQERLDQRNVVRSLENPHDTVDVNSSSEHL